MLCVPPCIQRDCCLCMVGHAPALCIKSLEGQLVGGC